LTVLLGLVFLVCAWPGWLRFPPYEPRRWAIETPPGLETPAKLVGGWHQDKKLLPEMRGLHLSPQTAHTFAWFCPEDKIVLDPVLAAIIHGTADPQGDWRQRMRDAGINHVILSDPDAGRLEITLKRLLLFSLEFPLLAIEGDTAIFGWRDPAATAQAGATAPFADWQFDPHRLAFHPDAKKLAPPSFSEEERDWWDAFWKPALQRSPAAGEATLHLFLARAVLQPPAPWELPMSISESVSVIGAAPGWTPPGLVLDAYRRLTPVYLFAHRDDTPPELLYLAVRAARKAVADNPQDAQAYFVLGQSYLVMLHSTRERVWGRYCLPEIIQLRYAQASTALNQAVTLRPNFALAHLELARMYEELKFYDLELEHIRTYFRLRQAAGLPPGADPKALREQEAHFEEILDRLAALVEKQEKAHAVAAAGASLRDQAFSAQSLGLAGKARDLLLQSIRAAFGNPGMKLELDLLLLTGRAEDVWKWTDPEQKSALGAARYHLVRANALAATGDYERAEAECEDLARGLREPLGPQVPLRKALHQAVCENVLANMPAVGATLPPGLHPLTLHRLEMIGGLSENLRQSANVTVLQGLLALEEGRVESAKDLFEEARARWRDDDHLSSGFIAKTCLDWLQK
jgi:tetratricopeptide (TPR) repeat protein